MDAVGVTPYKSSSTSQRPSIIVPVLAFGMAIIVGAVILKMVLTPAPPAVPAAPPATATAPVAPEKPVIRAIVPRADNNIESPVPVPVANVPGAAARVTLARATPNAPAVDPKDLMATLTSLDLKGPISPEDALKWKKAMEQLVDQGPSSIATIREYLAQNQDISFAGVQGADQLGYSSLRAGLLNALGQIGGPEATEAMLQTLQTTTFPSDVATLAATLQQQAPGQYDSQIMSAVRGQLSAASSGQLPGANVGPLFQLLANAAASGADVTADLQQYSSQWPYYAAIEMANLPNGAGISSLMQMLQNNTGASQSAAAQALAQLASQNSQALDSLVDLAKQGQLSDTTLAQLAPYLGGRENELGGDSPPGASTQTIHMANGNQDFAATDLINTLTPDQVDQRISMIDQLLQALPSDDTQAQQALQQQRGALAGRQVK